MSKKDNVKDIVSQIKKLQREQTTLISALERLSVSGQTEPKEATRELAVGDRVRITNPRLYQPNKGTIVKIGKRVTVQAKNGRKIIRKIQNLILEEDE
jgi:hypothetical protein